MNKQNKQIVVIAAGEKHFFEATKWLVHGDFQLDILRVTGGDETVIASFAPGWTGVHIVGDESE